MYKGIPREYDNLFKACIDVNQTNFNTKKEKQTQISTYNKEAIFHWYMLGKEKSVFSCGV